MRPTDTAKVLASRADEVASLLLPAGKKVGSDWCVGSTSGDPGKSLKVRIDGSKKGMWIDFAGGADEKGDLIGLWKQVRGLSLDQANKEALEWLGIPDDDVATVSPRIETTKAQESWKNLQTKLRKGTQAEISAVAAQRHIPNTAGLILASAANQLWFADIWDQDGFDHPAWILTDDARVNAQARKMDGTEWQEAGKCKTVYGTSSKWPIGIGGVNGHDIAFVEGSPDLLAAWHLIWLKGLKDKVSPVAMFGGKVPIPTETYPLFAGKTVYLFPHADKAGAESGARWASQLRQAKAAAVVSYEFKLKSGKDLNDLVAELEETEDGKEPAVLENIFKVSGQVEAKPLISFAYPPDDDPNILLGKDDYLGRGGGLLFVSHAGAGKSSWVMDACLMWGLGRPWMGIKCARKLKSLIIQAEDSDRYMGKIASSFAYVNKLGVAETSELAENVLIARVKGISGPAFFAELKRLTDLHQPDLVIVNPIYLYAEGDIGRSEFAQPFLLGLDAINKEEKFAYILIHHTGKPQAKNNKGVRAEVEDWESVYMGFGSSYLANWPRCSALLEPVAGQSGRYLIKLGKGGLNAGITKEVEQGAGVRLEPCTRIGIRHSTDKMKVGEREKPVYYWELDDTAVEAESITRAGRPTKYQLKDYLYIIPKHNEPGKTKAVMLKYATDDTGIKETAFRELLNASVKDGDLVKAMTSSGFVFNQPAPKAQSPSFSESDSA